MCVDDYQFRHQSANRQKICRRFVFNNQDGNSRIFLINISQFQFFGDLRLCEILLYLNQKGLSIKDYRFYLPQYNIKVQAGDECRVPFKLFTQKQVIFEMEKIDENLDFDWNEKFQLDIPQFDIANSLEENSMAEKSNQSMSDQNTQHKSKKLKEHEKTIRQALTKVKQWRALHEKNNYTLKNAANVIELSKKTLDDYYLVLRVGEQLNYNFEENLDQKIGHLRHFIRSSPIKVKGRLHKNLKSFSLVPESQDLYLPSIQFESKKQMQIKQVYSPGDCEDQGACDRKNNFEMDFEN